MPVGTIERRGISGLTVLGRQQYEYESEGRLGSLGFAARAVELQMTDAIQRGMLALSKQVRQRIRKLEELGDMLAILGEAQANTVGSGPDDTVTDLNGVKRQRLDDLVRKYELEGVTFSGPGGALTTADVSRDLAAVQQAINTENNQINLNTQALQNFSETRTIVDQRLASIINRLADGTADIIRSVE